MPAKFMLGHVVATPGALIAFTEAKDSIRTYLARHVSGDWGEVSREDAGETTVVPEALVTYGFPGVVVTRTGTGSSPR